MARHDELRKTWQPGQQWETCNLNRDGTLMSQWCPVGNNGYAEPVWDEHQEYRQCPPADPFLRSLEPALSNPLHPDHTQALAAEAVYKDDHQSPELSVAGAVPVTQVSRHTPSPTDVYVVDIPCQISHEQALRIAGEIQHIFQLPDQSRVLIMAGGARLKVVDGSIIGGNGHAQGS